MDKFFIMGKSYSLINEIHCHMGTGRLIYSDNSSMQVRYTIMETAIYTAYTMIDLLDDVLVFVVSDH